MDSPLSTLGFVIFGITFSIYSVIAESQSPSTSVSRTPSPPLPSPPHRPPPPPPPSPFSSPPPSPFPPPPPHAHSPPPHFSPHDNLDHAAPGTKANRSPANHNRHRHRSPPLPPSHHMNGGKKIGLLFAGIAGIMQIGVFGFLVFKRRQLLRTKDAFEASA